MYLGLDISTSCTGYSVLNENGSLVDIGYITLSKEKDHFCKSQKVLDVLSKLSTDYDIKKIYVEQNLQAFRPGFSSAKTLFSLARFNGIVCYICERDLKIKPETINVNVARKILNLKIVKKAEYNTKDQVRDWVLREINKNNQGFSWPNKTLKSGPNRGHSRIIKEAYDMADAYVIARAGVAGNTL